MRSNETIYDDCHMFSHVSGTNRLVGIYTHDNEKYILIGNELLDE